MQPDSSSDESTDQECSIFNSDISLDQATIQESAMQKSEPTNSPTTKAPYSSHVLRKRKPLFYSSYSTQKTENNTSSQVHDQQILSYKNKKLDFIQTLQESHNSSLSLHVVCKKISCIIWHEDRWKGADLSMFEISTIIISKVKAVQLGLSFFYVGTVFSFIITSWLIFESTL